MATLTVDKKAAAAETARELLDLGVCRAAVMRALVVQLHLTGHEAADALRASGRVAPTRRPRSSRL
jgi:hypothetical protein